MIDPKLREAFSFFYEWAGYSVPPGKAANALRMARTEIAMKAEGRFWFSWEWDQEEEGSEICCVRDRENDDDIVTCLCGIQGADANYRRVVETEMAQEAYALLESQWCPVI